MRKVDRAAKQISGRVKNRTQAFVEFPFPTLSVRALLTLVNVLLVALRLYGGRCDLSIRGTEKTDEKVPSLFHLVAHMKI